MTLPSYLHVILALALPMLAIVLIIASGTGGRR